MSNESYNHIKVTPAAEDDEVIVVGGVGGSAGSPGNEGAASAAASGQAVREVEPTASFESTASSASASANAKPVSNAQRGAGEKKDDYRETNMDDLSSSKMSGMQKGIVVVAILIVLAFVIYSVLA